MASGIFTQRQVQRELLDGSWVNTKVPSVEYLVVAGGGSGGASIGGGGGAGGLLQGHIPVSSGIPITVTVGAGGSGGQGGNTSFASITATGGGRGGAYLDEIGRSGGSGGGGSGRETLSVNANGGSGIGGQGNSGGRGFPLNTNYTGAGGGGAGTIGRNAVNNYAGNGGDGIASDISGTRTMYAGGGGGGTHPTGTVGSGGYGGGGAGTASGGGTGVAGTANLGGGGGGSTYSQPAGGAGGSGVVIISYPDTYANATSQTSGTFSYTGSGSLYVNGSSGITYPSATQFNLSGSSFTIQCWMYMTATTGYRTIITKRPAGGGPSYSLKIPTSSNKLAFGNSANELSFNSDITYNTWYHVAIVCDGTNTKLYLNGVYDGQVALNASTDNSADLAIGGHVNNGNEYMTGYISNLQVIKGVQLYTTAFTPPTSPIVNANGSSTSLLLPTETPFVGIDKSSYCSSHTLSGSPTWNPLTPFTVGRGLQNRVYTWTSSGTITF